MKKYIGLLYSLVIILFCMTNSAYADLADETRFTASDGAYQDYFSKSVDIDGDVMIFGAEGNDDNGTSAGAAYIYEYDSGSGTWLEQKLLADDGVAYDLFGRSVAVSGDIAIVGAIGSGATINATPGYAYIFVRNGTSGVWEQQQKLTASDGATDDFFGIAVAIDGNRAAVGATGVGSFNGAVYMFSRDTLTGVWSEEQKVLNSSNSAFDNFGTAIDIDGINMIVGADGDWGSGDYSGSAYLFARDSSASTGVFWTQVQHLIDPDGGHQEKFGTSVALHGDHAIVGGNWFDGVGGGTLNVGTALVFSRDPASGVWDSGQRLTPASASYHYELGHSVAISGNIAVVGGVGAGSDSVPGSGGAYVFQKLATGEWLELHKITSPNSALDNEYAWAMASSGDRFIVSAWGEAVGSRYEGAAYLYTDQPAPRITVADSTPPNNDSTLAFGEVTEFTTADQTLTITNDGKLDLVMGSVAAIDTVAAPFTIEGDSCSGQTLTPAASCLLDVRFSPQSTGAFSDSLDIPSNDPNTPSVTVDLSGTGTAVLVPDITVTDLIPPNDDLDLPFGDLNVGWSSSLTVTVTNDGTADLVLGDLATLDPLVAPYSLAWDPCSNTTLTPGASCQLGIAYQPTVAGATSDSFDIPSNDSDEPSVTVTVSGTAVSTSTPNIEVTDAVAPIDDHWIQFGDITVNTQTDQLVTVTNSGDADLNVGSIATANPLLSPYSIVADNCSGVVVSSQSNCSFTVRFSPTAITTYNESFDIPSDDPDQPSVTFNLSGTSVAVPAPVIAVTDTESPVNDLAVPFGNITLSFSVTEFVTVSNVGNADLVIGNVAVANPLAAPFSFELDNCSGQTLATNDFCSMRVAFSPQTAGNFSDSFDIPSNDGNNSSVTFSVSGSGMAAPEPEISISDNIAPVDDLQLVFGAVAQGATSDGQITISNDGSTNLNIGSIGAVNGLVAPFSLLNDACSGVSLLPTESCVVAVRYAPTNPGSFNDSFDVPSNDSDEPSITVTLSGTGMALPVPDIEVSATTLQFGSVTEQTSSIQTVTITNSGSAGLTIGTIGGQNGLQAPFALVNDQCSASTLAANGRCTLQVRFEPTAVGNFIDSFDIPSDDPDSATVTINLSGAGVEATGTGDDTDRSGGGGSLGLWALLVLVLVGRFSAARRC